MNSFGALLKKTGVLMLVLSGALQLCAYDWSGKTGKVTIAGASGARWAGISTFQKG